jgi:hypothetical protein
MSAFFSGDAINQRMVVKRRDPNYHAAISHVPGGAPGMAVDMRHVMTRNSVRARNN